MSTLEAVSKSAKSRARHELSMKTSVLKAVGLPTGLGTATSLAEAGAGAGAGRVWTLARGCSPGLGACLPVALPCRPRWQWALQRHSRHREHALLRVAASLEPSFLRLHLAPVCKSPLHLRPLLLAMAAKRLS